MDDCLTQVRNIGPAMAGAFRRAGIDSAAQLRALGADNAYARLLQHGLHRPHFIAYYTLVMGLQGRPWNDCKGPEKVRLRARFDALCKSHAPKDGHAPSAGRLNSILNEIGVIPAPASTESQS